jgi:hypothetical protein
MATVLPLDISCSSGHSWAAISDVIIWVISKIELEPELELTATRANPSKGGDAKLPV